MIDGWKTFTTGLSGGLRTLRTDAPDVMKAFSGLAQSALAGQTLDVKTKELIAMAIAVAVRCDDCIGFHAQALVKSGASREEVAETLGMAIYMGGGPSVMYANHALAAFNEFSASRA